MRILKYFNHILFNLTILGILSVTLVSFMSTSLVGCKSTFQGVITTSTNPNVAITVSGMSYTAATKAFNYSRNRWIDGSGNIYIPDVSNYALRKVDGTTGLISTIAGTAGTYGSTFSDGKLATNTLLGSPINLAFDTSGYIYFGDISSHSIRKISPYTGMVSTIVGNGFSSYTADGASALNTGISSITGLTIDTSGNIYYVDSGFLLIRKVNFADKTVTTVAGKRSGGSSPPPDGALATSVELSCPAGITLDSSNNLYFADMCYGVIYKVKASDGTIHAVAGNYASAGSFSGDGLQATSAGLQYPYDVAIDTQDNLYIADTYNSVIRKVNASDGIISTIAGVAGQFDYIGGDGILATNAHLNYPTAVTFDNAGNIYIADGYNYVIRKIDANTGIISRVVGTPGQYAPVTPGQYGDGGPATSAIIGYLFNYGY